MSEAGLIAANTHRWAVMHFTTSRIPEFEAVAKSLIVPARKTKYQLISTHVWGTSSWWAVVAVIDEREHQTNLGLCNSYLGNGQPLNHVTTLVPAGRGPFLNHPNDPPGEDAFYRGALDALIDVQHANKWADTSPGGWLTFLEGLNGLGYANKGLASPYIWGGTNQQQPGKYVADGVFSATTWDTQLGCAGMLRYMAGLDSSIPFGPPGSAPVPAPVPTPVPTPIPVPPPVVLPPVTPQPPTVPNMAALLQLILGNPTAMALLTSVISNPAIVQTITQLLNGLSSQVAAGTPASTAVQNLILTQVDLDAAAAVVEAWLAKAGLPAMTLDQRRDLSAQVIRSYISNVKAGK